MRVDLAYDEPARDSDRICRGCEGPVSECSCVRCSRCFEPVYFVNGIVGPERWKHVATGDARCSPTCQTCGKPATNKVLKYGRFDHWECNDCAPKTFRIDHL